MYQISILRFMFMTLFRSFSFVLGAVIVFLIKQKMEKKDYEKEMVSVKSRQSVGPQRRNYDKAGTSINERTSY